MRNTNLEMILDFIEYSNFLNSTEEKRDLIEKIKELIREKNIKSVISDVTHEELEYVNNEMRKINQNLKKRREKFARELIIDYISRKIKVDKP